MKELKTKLSDYLKRRGTYEVILKICFDNLDSHEEKSVQQELIYDAVVTSEITKVLPRPKGLYFSTIILINLTLERLFENYSKFKKEDMLLISFTPLEEENTYSIRWSNEF